MAKCLIIFEDEAYANFNPLALLRPVFMLRPGIRALAEKIIDCFDGYQPHYFCRPEIAELTSGNCRIPVNRFEDKGYDEYIFVNGRIRHNIEFVHALKAAGENVILTSGDDIAAFKLLGKLPDPEYNFLKQGDLSGFYGKFKERAETMNIELPMYGYIWDLVAAIDDEIKDDFNYFRRNSNGDGFLKDRDRTDNKGREFPGGDFINSGDIYIAADAEVLPGNVLDASKGPIFIGSRVRIEPHSYLVGPLYIGKESHVVGGKITGSSIGPVCRIGGEVEESIIQGYTNKYHAGFLGHAYLGEWINLGAMTTNSDLKNNYGAVSVMLNGVEHNTGNLKVGSFIGDFTKTAIGTLLNTGINIGLSCNIVADSLVTDKEIPSFTWYSPRHKMAYNLVKAIGVIERSMARRDKEPSEALKKRLKEIFATESKHNAKE